MARPPRRPRTIRVEDSLWDEAMATADARDEILSEVIRAALRRYIEANHR